MNRRIAFLGVAAVFAVQVAEAALRVPEVDYPTLTVHAPKVSDFVARGWKIERQADGDLNNDNRPDVALILRQTNPRNIVDSRSERGPRSFDTNPRVLVVALGSSAGGYDLALENRTLIPRPLQPAQEDSFAARAVQPSAIEIKNGRLRVVLGYFAAAKPDMGQVVYMFRYRRPKLELIGHDVLNIVRATGEMRGRSVNFLTRRVKHSSNNVSSGKPDKVVWKRLPPPPLPTLDQLGNGYDFDPTKL